MLLRAAAQIADRMPNAHYVIIGQRHSEKTESRQFERDLLDASARALVGRVHFLGRRNDVGRLLAELTLLAHPARQEPLGRVLLEAVAAGVAVVATAVGGTPEIFPPAAAPPDSFRRTMRPPWPRQCSNCSAIGRCESVCRPPPAAAPSNTSTSARRWAV